MKTIIATLAAFAAIAAGSVYDYAHRTCSIERDWTFSGHSVLAERCRGASGFPIGNDKIVAYLD